MLLLHKVSVPPDRKHSPLQDAPQSGPSLVSDTYHQLRLRQDVISHGEKDLNVQSGSCCKYLLHTESGLETSNKSLTHSDKRHGH